MEDVHASVTTRGCNAQMAIRMSNAASCHRENRCFSNSQSKQLRQCGIQCATYRYMVRVFYNIWSTYEKRSVLAWRTTRCPSRRPPNPASEATTTSHA
jgi:hypothetical protein